TLLFQNNMWSGWMGPLKYELGGDNYLFPQDGDVVAGRPVANGQEVVSQLNAFSVGYDGGVNVLWVSDYGQGQQEFWQRAPISPPGFIATIGAGLGLGAQPYSNEQDLFVIGYDTAVNVYKNDNNTSPWKRMLTPSFGIAKPGSPVGVALQRSDVMDA